MAVPHFQFTEPFGDARVEELKLLSWTAQQGELSFASVPSGPWGELLGSLVWNELLTVFSFERAKRAYASEGNPDPDLAHSSGLPGESPLERARVSARVRAIGDLYEMRPPAGLRLTHSGRARISELKQALHAGRIREQYGILWDGRHLETDLQIALLDASESAPLSVGFLDLNGLKAINDRFGHAAGEMAVRAYFQAVATALSDRGEGYGIGGDEVVVILPSRGPREAVGTLSRACRLLMGEQLRLNGAGLPSPSISVGVATVTSPRTSLKQLRHRADQAMYRAKARAHQVKPNPSVIAVGEEGEVSVIGYHDFLPNKPR
jgi:diguanylate cyclase (GGDEF)-like protein